MTSIAIKPGSQQRVLKTQLRCSDCGARTNAACDCGVSYLPARKYAAKEIAAHPEMSDAVIAKKLGISIETVRLERKQVPTNLGPDRRIGLDGKSYPTIRQNKIQPNDERSLKKPGARLFAPSSVIFGEIEEKIDELTKGVRQGEIKIDAAFKKQVCSSSNGLLALLKERPMTTSLNGTHDAHLS